MNILTLLPELEGDEMMLIQQMLQSADEARAQQFANAYRSRRKDPQTILLLGLLGFLGVAGVQRFVLDQVGMGLLYILTGGICVIGTIYDLVNYKKLTYEYNQTEARRLAAVLGLTS